MRIRGLKRSKKADLQALKCCLDGVRYVAGAVPYQGADDVTCVLYALILAIRAADQMGISEFRIAQEWARLLEKNAQFMRDMEIANGGDKFD